ncbi:MAG: acetolactate synthase catalytic subunit [Bacteroidetes bacterium]|nr:acetolactate synthase catalytic subunit [Bacteroidota bacterium]
MSDKDAIDQNLPTGAQRIAQALQRHGVQYLFGQSNPPSVTLAAHSLGVKQIGYRTENAGSYMADGFARVSGKIPVVTAQNGPAATLLVPGLAECLNASTPIVALVQDVANGNRDRNAFQELDHLALFQGVAKWVRRISAPERIEDYVDMAFTAAASGRPGPAVLLCPADIFPKRQEPSVGRSSSIDSWPLDRFVADPSQVELAAEILVNAERPLVYAGGGVIGSRAQQELRALQEQTGLPVATTTMGKGSVDETHPLSIGVIGFYMGKRGMSRYARHMVDTADVILLVGNRTNQNGTDSWNLLPRNAHYIHLDIDPNEIGRNYESVRLLGDIKATLPRLLEAMKLKGLEQRSAARAVFESEIREARALHAEEVATVTTSSEIPLRPERLMAEVEQLLDDNAIVVADASFSSIWIANFLKAKQRRQFITPRGLAGLGWGFPMAMGAKLANPERTVFCLVGDGGFGHVWSELETARRHGINVILMVLNNQVLGYQLHAEEVGMGAHTDACDLTGVDHAAVAEACGLRGIRVEHPDALKGALEQAVASDQTVLLDCIVDPDAMPPVGMFSQLTNY